MAVGYYDRLIPQLRGDGLNHSLIADGPEPVPNPVVGQEIESRLGGCGLAEHGVDRSLGFGEE
jgi:hypothetical protein